MLGRKPYERAREPVNYRNGAYHRRFTLKGIGWVTVRVPRDRNGEFRTSVLHRSKQYEEVVRQDLSLMFLNGVSTRTLSLISGRLVGRSLRHQAVSQVNREPTAYGYFVRSDNSSGETKRPTEKHSQRIGNLRLRISHSSNHQNVHGIAVPCQPI